MLGAIVGLVAEKTRAPIGDADGDGVVDRPVVALAMALTLYLDKALVQR